MNRKELGEIRRRIRPEHNSIRRIYGCYVNSNKEIIACFEESVGLLDHEELEKYFSLLKRTLSGSLGKNLLDISLSTKDVMDSEELHLLTALRKSELQDSSLREAFYRNIIDHADLEEQNYLILLAYDIYDVPRRSKDGEPDDSDDVYPYILCCLCPVKEGKAELGYVAAEKRFHRSSSGQIAANPELGFLYPCFDDRAANIYHALLYSRNVNLNHDEFVDAVFRASVPVSAGQQKEHFNDLLTEVLDRNCRFDVVQALHEQLTEKIELYKETKDPEPMTITVEEMGEILENSGASPEEAQVFCAKCTDSVGAGGVLNPGNLTNTGKMEIVTPEVKISVNPKFSHLVEARIVDGKKYILVSADAGVELNGVPVRI